MFLEFSQNNKINYQPNHCSDESVIEKSVIKGFKKFRIDPNKYVKRGRFYDKDSYQMIFPCTLLRKRDGFDQNQNVFELNGLIPLRFPLGRLSVTRGRKILNRL